MFDLRGSFAFEGPEFVVRYNGVNRFHEPLFVARLPLDARFKVHPNNAYCSLSPDGTLVNLILGESPLPNDREVEFGVRAFFVKLPPDETVTGEIRLKSPLQEWNGYFLPHKHLKTDRFSVRQVVLHVDVIQQSAVTWTRPSSAAVDHWSIGGPLTRCSVEILLDVLLPVARRNDEFPRP